MARDEASVSIRSADPDEAAALGRLAREAKGHWGYSAAQLERWHDELTPTAESIRRWPTFVAEIEGEAAGFVQLNTESTPWELEHLWVAPRCMRRGVGRALLTRALAEAAANGEATLAIDADPHAERFYVAAGARRIGAVAAPIDGEPNRVRPQLRLAVATAAA